MSFFQAICLWLLQERILNQLLIEHPQTYPHRREASQVWDLRKKLHCQLQPLLPQDDPYQGGIWFLKKDRSRFFFTVFFQDKPHPCPECPRSFPTPGDLRHHSKIHSSSPSSSPFTFQHQPSAPNSPSPPSPTTDLTAQREAIANLFKTISEEKPFTFFQKDRFDSLVFWRSPGTW